MTDDKQFVANMLADMKAATQQAEIDAHLAEIERRKEAGEPVTYGAVTDSLQWHQPADDDGEGELNTEPIQYDADLVNSCAYRAHVQVPDVVECLDIRMADKLDTAATVRTQYIWRWWVAGVMASHSKQQVTVEQLRDFYAAANLGREGSQVRRQLINGHIPDLWKDRIAPAWKEWRDSQVDLPADSQLVETAPVSHDPTPQAAAVAEAAVVAPTTIEQIAAVFSSGGLTRPQLEKRTRLITASEIGAIAGLNQWKTPLDVYLEKVEGVKKEVGKAAEYGTILEPVVLWLYMQWLGVDDLSEVQYPMPTMTHADHPWMGATPDAIVGRTLADMKTTGIQFDEPPAQYVAQLHWQYAVCESQGFDLDTEMHLPTLVGRFGFDLQVHRVDFDRDYLDELITIGERFVIDHINARVPPEPQIGECAKRWPFARHEGFVEADERAEEVLVKYREWLYRRALCEDRIAKCEKVFQERIGDAAGIKFADDTGISWKNNRRYDWEAIAIEAGATQEQIEECKAVDWRKVASLTKPSKTLKEAHSTPDGPRVFGSKALIAEAKARVGGKP